MEGWIMHRQEQQRGAQFQSQDKGRNGAPADAVKGREAQDHEFAKADAAPGGEPEAGDYPASAMPHGHADNTPTAPTDRETAVRWDDVVQPERDTRPNDDAAERQRREQAKEQGRS